MGAAGSPNGSRDPPPFAPAPCPLAGFCRRRRQTFDRTEWRAAYTQTSALTFKALGHPAYEAERLAVSGSRREPRPGVARRAARRPPLTVAGPWPGDGATLATPAPARRSTLLSKVS